MRKKSHFQNMNHCISIENQTMNENAKKIPDFLFIVPHVTGGTCFLQKSDLNDCDSNDD